MFSFIIPIYQNHSLLDEAILSIFNLELPSYEILVVDDGSPNPIVIDRANVNVFRLDKNSGPGCARNIGLSKASGEYIVFLDSDDVITPDFLKVTNYINNYEKDIDVYVARLVDSNSPVKFYPESNTYIKFSEDYRLAKLNDFSSNIYKRSFLISEGLSFPEHTMRGEDTIFYLNTLVKSSKISVSNEGIYQYRRRAGSLMNRGTSLEESYFLICDLPRMLYKVLCNLEEHAAVRMLMSFNHKVHLASDLVKCGSPLDTVRIASAMRFYDEIGIQDYLGIKSNADIHLSLEKIGFLDILSSSPRDIEIIDWLRGFSGKWN